MAADKDGTLCTRNSSVTLDVLAIDLGAYSKLFEVITTLMRSFNGLNLSGIEFHVFLPMITTFLVPAFDGVDVTRRKYFISLDRRHGRLFVLDIPIPFVEEHATMRVKDKGALDMSIAVD